MHQESDGILRLPFLGTIVVEGQAVAIVESDEVFVSGVGNGSVKKVATKNGLQMATANERVRSKGRKVNFHFQLFL
jgi:hypothetical protein